MMYKLSILFMVFALAFAGWSGWMFYFGDCKDVSNYWMLVQTPARCIAPEPQNTPDSRGMCLVGTFPTYEDFQLSKSKAGSYRYEIYITTKGIEVWESCDQKSRQD